MDSADFLVWLEHLRSGATDWVFIKASWLGLSHPYMAVLVSIYLCVGHRFGFRLLVVFLLSAYSNGHLKMEFDTLRPFVADPERFADALYTDSAGGGAFPSGHAQNAAAVYGLIAVRLRSWGTRAPIILLILLISFSRLYCQVHWPVDVIGGLLIGFLLIVLFLTVLGAWQASGRRLSLGHWAIVVIVVAGLMNLLALLRLGQAGFEVEDVKDCLRAAGGLLGVGLGYVLVEGRGYDART
ncbi:MAG: phosphatase PAP2 family protein, partial [Armatimonadota bacterium]